ncbi:NAD(P)H-binding protein [Sphingomonas sp. Y38-1Y]|uniref:NAD(P)H-binding protein n=1 Tax=Sphingomonas sp. Y38-1Y TaxID=3078265 RepID=UPI0028EF0F1B|nr:NAD(P)H-binding protein [Sphingomonas sp. Y38-1Y]
MIVVTTPTGQVGHHVVRHLLAEGSPVRIVARDAARLEPALTGRVEIVEGSHGDPAVIDRALVGADALFWLVPPDTAKTLEAAYLDFTRPAVEAIRRHGIARVVSVTALGRDTRWQDRAGLVTASIAMDDLLMSSGAAFRGLAMPSFMDNLLRQVASIAGQGIFYGTIDPDRRAPTTATADMGAVAARLLLDRGWAGQAEQPVLGPEDLSFAEMAVTVGEVLDRPVRYQPIPLDAFQAQLLARGMSGSFAQGYVDMMRAKDEGIDNVARRDAASATPTRFRDWCERVLKPAVDKTA